MKKTIFLLTFALLSAFAFAQSSLVLQVNAGLNEWTTSDPRDVNEAYNTTLESLPTSPTQFGVDALIRPIPFLSIGLGYRYFMGDGPRNEFNFKVGPTIPLGAFELSPMVVGGLADGIVADEMHFAVGVDVDAAVRIKSFGFHVRPGLRVFNEDLPYLVNNPQANETTFESLRTTIFLASIEAGISLKLNLSGDEE